MSLNAIKQNRPLKNVALKGEGKKKLAKVATKAGSVFSGPANVNAKDKAITLPKAKY